MTCMVYVVAPSSHGRGFYGTMVSLQNDALLSLLCHTGLRISLQYDALFAVCRHYALLVYGPPEGVRVKVLMTVVLLLA